MGATIRAMEKAELRRATWAELRRLGAARFPGAAGRIPNFTGAEAAAARVSRLPEFRRAEVLKCNPDLPQRKLRHLALLCDKRVYLAVPRLREERPFVHVDPRRLDATQLWHASSIVGAAELGRPVRLQDVPTIDLVVTGSVAVAPDGARLGKGGGYSDLEYALLREDGKLGPRTPVVTTVHPCQVARRGEIEVARHDVSVDLFATPEEVVRCRGRRPRPKGILWDALEEEKRAEIPVLARRRRRRPTRE